MFSIPLLQVSLFYLADISILYNGPIAVTTALVTLKASRHKNNQSIFALSKRRSSLKMSGSSPSPSPLSKWIVSSLHSDDENKDDNDMGENASLPLTHLFLHFDINETILLGDNAGGDSRHESTQKMLAKSSFCRMPETENNDDNEHDWLRLENTKNLEPTKWWDGQEIGREHSLPKLYTGWKWPKNCCPYYRTAYKKQAKSFVENHQIYLPVLEACEAAISVKGRKLHHKDTILPAFYETLHHLIITSSTDSSNSKKPPFTIIFRTFGSDLAEISSVVTTFAKGEHPRYPDVNFPSLCLSEDRLYQGRWKVIPDDNSDTIRLIYQLWKYHDESQLVASGEDEILDLLKEGSIFGIRDDYNFWKGNLFNAIGGKPIWIRNYDDTEFNNDKPDGNNNEEDNIFIDHHILFDDNIHNLRHEGIACVRKELPGDDDNSEAMSFETVDGANIDLYHGVHLVRVPTVEPVLNPRWYIQQIEMARNRFQRQFQRHQSPKSNKAEQK